MILTDYYKFEKVALKSMMRLDCVASTGSYPELEEKRAAKATKASVTRDATNVGDLVVYYGDVPERFGGDVHRKAGKSLTIRGNNLSSIFEPDPQSGFAFGDYRGSNDALLFVFKNFDVVDRRIQAGGIMEIFIARGKSKDSVPLYQMMCDGALDEEMEMLRLQAANLSKASKE